MFQAIIALLFLSISLAFAKPYTDMLGRVVDVSSAKRLIFIGPGALRLGVYLGLEKRLVGVEQQEHEPSMLSPYRTFLGKERLAQLPIIGAGGPGKMPNLEALIAQKPDLIIASFFDKAALDLIQQKTAIPVLALSYGASYGGSSQQLSSMKHALTLLGEVTGRVQRALEITEFMSQQEAILAKTPLHVRSVYIGGVGYKGAQGITSTEANYPPFELLGLKNALFKDKNLMGHHFIDFEALIRANPDHIFIDHFGKAKIDQERSSQKALFHALKAFQNGDVSEVLAYNFYATNIENLFVIAYQIATTLGAPYDLQKEVLAIYRLFYGKNGEALLEQLPYGFSLR